jgi:hypothetical protein
MKGNVPLILFLGFCRVAPVLGGDPASDSKIFLDSIENGQDVKNVTVTEWYISPEELDRLPAFNPALDDPLVSLRKAVAIAQGALPKDIVPGETQTLTSVELLQIDRGNSGVTSPGAWRSQETGKWYFKVTFSIQRPEPAPENLLTYPYPVYVLMDGTISQRRERLRTKEEAERDKQESEEWTDSVLKAAKKAQ